MTVAVDDDLPPVANPALVGDYPAKAFAGGGFVWDEVLEYRVWCCPRDGAEDLEDGNDYYYAFATYREAAELSRTTSGAQKPVALVLQREYLDEPNPGEYVHMPHERVTEWPIALLRRPRRTADTIPRFLAPDAPANRLDILRGTADPEP